MSAEPNGPRVIHTLTRSHPQGWPGFTRRIDHMMLDEILAETEIPQRVFICGPTAFVESVATGIVANGIDAERVRTERFGPSG